MKPMTEWRQWTSRFLLSLALVSSAAQALAAGFLNGPYLLAPTATGMTVSFEARGSTPAKVKYGTSGQAQADVDVACQRGAPWQGNPEGDCMYRAVLTGLAPATLYDYTVALASGETRTGTFRTLKDRPDEVHIFTISDSHAFKGSKALSEALLRDRPDFVLHTGDLPAGLGYQKEKYQQSWFAPGAEFLKHIPVVYINGNHDVGPHFAEYFMVAQRNTYNASPNDLNYSFDYGPVHFVMVNSNPWGLSEMNADLSDLPVHKKTLVEINDSLEWLHNDLESATAKQAKWRIVGMHHPYTDSFSFKRVVNVIENGGVDLMLAGHLHGYQKGISIDPARAARTVFITQGTAESVLGEITYGKADERIFPEFPEVVSFGRAIFHTLDIVGDRLSFKVYGLKKGEAQVKLLDETVLSRNEPSISVSGVKLSPVKGAPGSVLLEAIVKNEGSGIAGVVLSMKDNGHEVPINLFGAPGKERVVIVNPGETKAVRKTITIEQPGKHTIRVAKVSRTLSIPEPHEKFVFNRLTARVGRDEYSNTVFATVEVINPHKVKTIGPVDLMINGKVVASRLIALQPNEKVDVSFSHQFQEGGEYQLKVGDQPAKDILIESVLKGTPLVRDMSGHGNHAILRGNPKITRLDNGAVSVDLAGSPGDYIEIPDRPSLRVSEGVSGIVWANLNRLPREGEMDRSPIMSKGPSLGWGANYLLRMLVKRSGGAFTAGICYDTSEYFWEGEGKAPLSKWAQYSMSFSKDKGGANYLDGEKAAETPAVNGDFTGFRNWEDHPIFIGYARLGNLVKEYKRPKNFAHFVGQISQVRFYTTALSAEEIRTINENPSQPGPKTESLAAWLNFEDIQTEGTHRTPWQSPAYYAPKFRADKQRWTFGSLLADAKVPAGTSLVATVEVSDNEGSAKGSKELSLRDGKQTIDLTGLPSAQYLRIVTRFKSVAGAEGVLVPELKLYKVSAALAGRTTQLTWGTRADWEKGFREGALGFEPPDRLTTLGAGPAVRN